MQGLAAAMALIGAVLWLRVDIVALVPWLVGFLVLTIAAEQVEASLGSRYRPAPGAPW